MGLDCGEASSATAAFAIWPETGRCEAWMAFGDNPEPADDAGENVTALIMC